MAVRDNLATPAPILFVLSGPSGVGKDTVLQRLRSRFPEISYPVTVTTRSPRPGEVEGTSYHFADDAEFRDLEGQGALVAVADVHGHRYGVPVEAVRRALDAGRDVLLKIDVQGAAGIRRDIPGAVLLFLAPPSLDALIDRLRARHTEAGGDLERRLRDARHELEQVRHYDYRVVNRAGDIEGAVERLACIVVAERHRVARTCPRVPIR